MIKIETITPEPQFEIGTIFIEPGHYGLTYEITDILKTYNNKNELVKVMYVCESEIGGVPVIPIRDYKTEKNVLDSNIKKVP